MIFVLNKRGKADFTVGNIYMFIFIFHKIDVPGPLLRRDDLWFDFCKRAPSVSDHLVFAFWVVAYGGVECR